MTQASTWIAMSPQLRKVAERPKQEPDGQFHSLAHLLDESALYRAYYRQREKVLLVNRLQHLAQGVLDDLVLERGDPQRSCFAIVLGDVNTPDRLMTIALRLQSPEQIPEVVRQVLPVVLLGDPIHAHRSVLDCSYGFRPGRSAHDAVRALHQVADKGEMSCVLEADIRSFFDCVDRTALVEMLQERVADGSLLRLVSKC